MVFLSEEIEWVREVHSSLFHSAQVWWWSFFSEEIEWAREVHSSLFYCVTSRCSRAKPTESRCSHAKSTESRCSRAKFTESRCSRAKPTESRCSCAKPTESRCSRAKPTESRCSRAKPTENRWSRAKPTESRCSRAKPTESRHSAHWSSVTGLLTLQPWYPFLWSLSSMKPSVFKYDFPLCTRCWATTLCILYQQFLWDFCWQGPSTLFSSFSAATLLLRQGSLIWNPQT